MIAYKKIKEDFLDDVSNHCIEDIIREEVKAKLKLNVGESEYDSWKHSLNYMYHVLNIRDIPNDSMITIEFKIPGTSNRIDFIISGRNEFNIDHAVIVELKGWKDILLSGKDAHIETYYKHGMSEELHPSYQAWSYSTLLQGFNEVVYNEKIVLKPCAYLHNHIDSGVINNDTYSYYTKKAPAFCKGDKTKLQEFIKKYVRYGDKADLIYRIENSRIRPSKELADSVSSMLKNNEEFVLIEDQKKVYEEALSLAKKSKDDIKQVLIIEGGPGTGKSVIAVSLLANLTKIGFNTRYVSKNAAPRAVYESKLTKDIKKSAVSNLFIGSGAFIESDPNLFDTLIVDEAHRLNAKSGLFKNLGENQIKEIINASSFSVFFVDEDQQVTLHDIGDKESIIQWAEVAGANVFTRELKSQFRCSGSDGYISWLDHTLQIKETANVTLGKKEHEFKIFSTPDALRNAIIEKNEINNKSRLVAGYCWDWVSKKNPTFDDIVFPEHNFSMKWNLDVDGSLWIISPKSINEIGCIHTCQGLEVDYVGVIVGPDLVARNDTIITDPSKRSKMDQTIKGYKRVLKEDPLHGTHRIDRIIKNTYRTLLTRGRKGCYVYFTDQETENYFRSRIE